MRCMRIALRVAVAVLVAASAGVSAAENQYRVEMFIAGQRPGGPSNQLFDLNNRGEVIGEDFDRHFREEEFLWSAGKFQSLSVDGLEWRP